MTNRNLLSKKIILGLTTATLCYGPFGVGYAEDTPQQPAVDVTKIIPTGASGSDITSGNVKIVTSEEATTMNMNVFQTTDRAIINWNTFNVGEGSTVNFIQTKDGKPNVSAMTLNRVVGNNMSEIAGTINSIGSFILVNPNGTMFYENSTVNAAGVVISTAEIDQNEFINNGKLIFDQKNSQNENIIVKGTINASTNGTYVDTMLSNIKTDEALMAKVKENFKNSPLNLDGIQLATGFSVANNTIKLVADGDIVVGNTGSLQAVTSTTISGDKTVGTEEFSVEGDSSTRLGSITLRADQNADDVNSDGVAAKVYLKNENSSQIASHSVGIYYNPDLVEHDVNGEKKTINGAKVADLGLTDTKDSTYTQKDYTKYRTEADAYKGKVAQTFTEISRDNAKNIKKVDNRGIVSQSCNMLVNNLYQMEAIQYSDKANMSGSYAQGRTFSAADTVNWNKGEDSIGKGFKPIGTFKGSFTGSGGSNTYSITDLTINRRNEDNVGLFGVANGASFWSINLVDSKIIGKNNVGGIAGQATNHSKFSSVNVRKRVVGSDGSTITANKDNVFGIDNVGGIVGELTDGTIRFSSNGSQVSGHNNVGGLAGNLSGVAAGGAEEGSTYNIYKSSNNGFYSDTENVEQGYGVIKSTGYNASNIGGLVGVLASTNKDTTGVEKEAIIESKSNGQVQGVNNVGGLVGDLKSGTVKWSYNTNEDAALSKNSVVSEASVGAGTSIYGRVNGTTNVGGIVGNMDGGKVEESYNAGNVEGTTNVGGIVGNMSGGEITKAYNADNNTVLFTSGAIANAYATNDKNISAGDKAKYYGFTDNDGNSYTYNQTDQKWIKTDKNNISSETDIKDLPAENERTYYNRLAYRDATVTGETNVGGIVGYMSKSADADKSDITQVYNAGQVKIKNGVSNTESVGAFIGKYDGGTVNDSFYVTTANDVKVITDADGNVTTKNDGTPITNQAKAVGNKDNYEFKDNITAKTLYQAQNTKDVTWTDGKNTAKGWTIYTNSSTPLLNHFMKWININRQYEYDGTVHNLMTTDVANYYGGAFFNNGDGKNVYSKNYGLVKDVITGGYKASDWVIKSGSANADTSHSSVYTYNNSTMWSPQHGYYTSDDARMIITPKTVTATIKGEKTYGEDAVVGVVDGSEPIKGKYNMTVTGFIGNDKKEDVFTITDTDQVKYIGDSTHPEDSNQLGAGTYEATGTADKITTFKNPTFTNKYNNYNYRVTFKDILKVNKARLDVGLVGTKTYGEDNSKGIYEYYALRRNTNSSDDTLNNGNLKSFDYKNDYQAGGNDIPMKNQGTKKIDSDKVIKNNIIKKLEANTNVTQNGGTDSESNVINENTDILIHKESDGKYSIYSYKLGNVELDGNDIEKNYVLYYSNEGTLDILPKDVTVITEPSGRKVLPDTFTPETNPEMFREILTPVKPNNAAQNHPDVFDNIEDEHFAEQIQETAEDTKTGAAEESKKIRYGGYIPKEARDGIRFITVEDTGINVEDAKVEHTTITIEPDSLVEGSNEVVINGDAEAAAE